MSTAAQIAANQQNAQHSTGPRSEEGKANSCLNNFRHGFAGAFKVLPWENQEAFDSLAAGFRAEHQPATVTETALVEKMAQHHWLTQRALILQDTAFNHQAPACEQEKQFALYLRYQTTQERAFHRCLNTLLKLRAETRKAMLAESKRAEELRIGFESQQRKEAQEVRKQADQARREAAEKRKQELHQVNVWLVEAKAHRQETETTIAQAQESVRVERANRIDSMVADEVSRQITRLAQAA